MFKKRDPQIRTIFFKISFYCLLGIFLFMVLILSLRGIMNAISRADFISDRLDDYPRLYESYLKENEEWWNWWQTQDYEKRAEQAAYIYQNDGSFTNENEKLSSIAAMLSAEKAQIVSAAEYEAVVAAEQAAGLETCSSKLIDGRILVLSLDSTLKQNRMEGVEDLEDFLSRLQAGLDGYILLLHEGELTVYPQDSQSEAVLEMVSSMLSSGKLNPDALTEKARSEGKNGTVNVSLSTKTENTSKRQYVLYCAAYSDNPDFLVNAVPASEMFRFARKRSWSLWFLCSAVIILLAVYLHRTRLYVAEEEDSMNGIERTLAFKRGISILFLACLLIFLSVLFTQMLSGVNQSAQAAVDEAAYVRSTLQQESERADRISTEFDNMYAARATVAASVLSRNPQLIDMEALHELDTALGGTGLRVFDADGKLVMSCDALHENSASLFQSEKKQSSVQLSADGETIGTLYFDNSDGSEASGRIYHAVMNDTDGKSIGLVELSVSQEQLDELLQDTRLQDVIGEMHILDTLHVIAVDAKKQKIIAGTYSNWIGDNVEEHGIEASYFYDNYEGIVNFDGSRCYSVVFLYNDSFVVVGSEDTTAIVFIGGVLLLSLVLILILIFVVYKPLSRLFYELQKTEAAKTTGDHPDLPNKNEYPLLWNFLKGFMFAVFLLSAVLYLTTKGNPTGLTYNIVRGTWVRGINAVTVTTSIMLASVVFAGQMIFDVACSFLENYLSPKGRTICRLIDSGCAYTGAIVMIIFTLSMFGVNTATLIGGVGAAALVITLGANSLIADVLAGLFIIFEGDYTVGDVVVINDFRGIVTDISMRTTKLMDDNSKDILIVSNSSISQLINQSREESLVMVDIPISRSVGLEKGEEIIKAALSELPAKYPKIIGEPEYWGVCELPSKNAMTGKLGGCKARIAFKCLENDKEMLTYQVYRRLVWLVTELNVTANDQ